MGNGHGMSMTELDALHRASMGRQLRAAGATIWLTTCVALIAFFGDSIHSTSADLGHHAVLVSRLMETWSLPDVDANLQYMASYPRGAHLLASIAGQFSGSSILGMNTVALLAVFCLWSAIGAALSGLESGNALKAAGCVGAALLLNTLVGLEVFGSELIANYFFAHMVSQALAVMLCVLALRREGASSRTLVSYLALGAGAPLLTSVHLLPALELLGTLAILVFANFLARTSANPKRELATGLLILAAAIGLTLANPAFRAMFMVSGHEGATALRHVTGLPALVAVAIVGTALSSTLMVVWWRGKSASRSYPAIVAKYFGALGLSVSGLCLIQLLLHSMFDVGSRYACFKYAIGMQSLILINLALLASRFWKTTNDPTRTSGLSAAILPAALATCAILSLFLRSPAIPIHPWVSAETDARTYVGENRKAANGRQDIAVDIPGVPSTGSYLISRTSLRNADEWMLYEILQGHLPTRLHDIDRVFTGRGSDLWDVRACRRGSAGALIVLDAACVADAIAQLPCSGTILFSSSGPLDKVTHGFSVAESNGRWSAGKRATLRCQVRSALPDVAYLNAIGFVTEKHAQRMLISVNGSAAQTVEFTPGAPSQIVAIPLPRPAPSELMFTFTFPDAISPKELGLSSDARTLAVKMYSLRFE